MSGLETYLAQKWKDRRKELLGALSSDRYRSLTSRFVEMLRQPAPATSHRTIGELARKSLGRVSKRVLKKGRQMGPSSTDADVHSLRIDCKRLRYLMDIFLPVFGKPLKGDLNRLKRLQRVLGRFQDACVAAGQLGEYTGHIPLAAEGRGQLVLAGRLIQCHRQRAMAQRAEFRQAWSKFDRKGWRKELLSHLDT
jgi:CHAD domain-containing protein